MIDYENQRGPEPSATMPPTLKKEILREFQITCHKCGGRGTIQMFGGVNLYGISGAGAIVIVECEKCHNSEMLSWFEPWVDKSKQNDIGQQSDEQIIKHHYGRSDVFESEDSIDPVHGTKKNPT